MRRVPSVQLLDELDAYAMAPLADQAGALVYRDGDPTTPALCLGSAERLLPLLARYAWVDGFIPDQQSDARMERALRKSFPVLWQRMAAKRTTTFLLYQNLHRPVVAPAGVAFAPFDDVPPAAYVWWLLGCAELGLIDGLGRAALGPQIFALARALPAAATHVSEMWVDSLFTEEERESAAEHLRRALL
ncbi:hypothetical protein STCU_10518 [Strigomonas culicis]|uniref:Uncharacterized protein n=1 Tax=Strigomonas culicis TaxID=28005 RepID=S9TMP3_9TRYP|nr:hypothetical protein STCU_10518 [Strigomonas culicis]|eukprot:EPY17593.1 hypothetical protein STCU_10518 [Strigomonas culicis]